MLQTTPLIYIVYGLVQSWKLDIYKMKLQGIIISLNIINVLFLMIFFFLLLSHSIQVEGMRPLKDQSAPSVISLIINQAYSGPSHKGRGHWTDASCMYAKETSLILYVLSCLCIDVGVYLLLGSYKGNTQIVTLHFTC